MASTLAVLACLGVAYVLAGYALAHTLRAKRLAYRESVSFEKIYVENFQRENIPQDAAERLWNETAIKLKLDPRKLRPGDRFDSELSHQLSLFPFVDLNDDFYWWTVDRMKALQVNNTQFENARTLADYVRLFAPLELRND